MKNFSLSSKKWLNGFTLVELIVVIIILAILWTISFLSFQWYSKDARDSVRLSDIKNIETWLEVFSLRAWIYPEPDNSTSYSWWNNIIFKQWVFWDNATRVININKNPIDPKTKSKYTYSVSRGWNYYQIWADSENSQSSIINTSYASNSNSAIVRWNYSFDPSLPSLIVVPSSITSSWIFDQNVCFVIDWWKNSLNNCIEKKKDMSLKDYDGSLVWYWDMETLSWSMLKDLSWNGNDWSASGGVVIGGSGWIIGKSTFLDGINDYFEVTNNSSLNLTNTHTFEAIYTYSKAFTWAGWNPIFNKPFTSHIPPYYQYHFGITSPLYNSTINQCGFGDTFLSEYKFDCWNTLFNNQSFYFVSVYNWNTNYLYVNGTKVNESKVDANFTDYGRNLYIWSYGNLINFGSAYYLAWNIDELKIYNRALSDQEVAQQSKIAWF